MSRSGQPLKGSLTDRLAAELEIHVDADDIAAGRGTELDPGGNVRRCGERLGLNLARSNSLFQGIRHRLGPQAR